ncbi:MAG: S8 family serine peptidase [Actinomycetota bacterium]
MARSLAVTWNDRKQRGGATLLTVALITAFLSPAGQAARSSSIELVSVIVREMPFVGDTPETLVESLGGEVTREIAIIGGFSAIVPEDSVDALDRSPAILSVTPDTRIRLTAAGYDPKKDPNSLYSIAQEETGAAEFWNDGYSGQGVGVALIDSGVLPVDGLTSPGKIVNGPDLSYESQVPELLYMDTFGHGTHMAGIIAGRDDDAPVVVQKGDEEHFLGIAPDAHIINIKVADAFGATDVSQVLAAIDWVVTHKDDPGLNIRVLNLSFGTDGVQDYLLDPLTYAVEVAWHHGIVVVVAGGNRGFGSSKLSNPAYDPFVIAVGAATTDGEYDAKDDTVAAFSSRGDALRGPDLVAPGTSVASLRAPGSFIDENNPQAVVDGRFFRGSGTSQAAAVVSGAAALIIEQRPAITPDQVKALLMGSTNRIPRAPTAAQGAGLIDLKEARGLSLSTTAQPWVRATGLGSLDPARGTARVTDGISALDGERDIFGDVWDAPTWAALAASGEAWSEGDWLGKTWSGGCWCGSSWAGKTWSSGTWTARSWSGKTWSSDAWTARSWSGTTWTGDAWTARSWSGKTWSGDVWSGSMWR